MKHQAGYKSLLNLKYLHFTIVSYIAWSFGNARKGISRGIKMGKTLYHRQFLKRNKSSQSTRPHTLNFNPHQNSSDSLQHEKGNEYLHNFSEVW